MFICSKCQKEFKYNYLLIRHNNRKKSCLIENNIIEPIVDDNNIEKNICENNSAKQIDKEIRNTDKELKQIDRKLDFNLKISLKNNKCNFCEKEYSKKYNLLRHIKDFCVCVKELNDKKNKLLEHKNFLFEKRENIDSKLEINELRHMVAKLLKKKSTSINITNNNKITNNNLMVNINSFGNESLSHITINDYKRFLSGLFPGFIKFIEKVHFDENAPENHNICITNMNSKYLFTFDKGNWLSRDKNDTIDTFIAKKYNILVNKFDELEGKNELDDKILERFNIFAKNYQDKEAQKNTKNDIMLMMYNNKNKVNMK
jgi:hypothetical protein